MSDVLGVVEHRRGELRQVSLELLSAGADLADSLDGSFHVAVIGGDVEAFADRLDRDGVDVIHTVENGAEFNHDVVVETVDALCERLSPAVLLAPHTVNALDYVPAVAVDRELPVVTDVTAIEVPEENGQLVATRGYYESKMTAPVTVEERPAAVTIRPGEWPVAEGIGDAERRFFEFSVDESALGSTVEGYEEAGAADVDVTAADFLIGVGRGVEDEADLELIEDLAAATDATIAASRPLVDRGWFDTGRQVGQSGKTVAPEVYLAIGISGAIQHVTGIKGADRIVAVNTDPNAPIFDIADLAIVGDLYDVVPALTETLR
jgi:electron transfer flavoprotein alpha subunit